MLRHGLGASALVRIAQVAGAVHHDQQTLHVLIGGATLHLVEKATVLNFVCEKDRAVFHCVDFEPACFGRKIQVKKNRRLLFAQAPVKRPLGQ